MKIITGEKIKKRTLKDIIKDILNLNNDYRVNITQGKEYKSDNFTPTEDDILRFDIQNDKNETYSYFELLIPKSKLRKLTDEIYIGKYDDSGKLYLTIDIDELGMDEFLIIYVEENNMIEYNKEITLNFN